jgi:flagellar export protein FliJ
MTRFRFALERAWSWRRRQMEVAERQLEALLAERAALAAALERLIQDAEAAMASIAHRKALDAALLGELSVWKEYSVEEARRRRAQIVAHSGEVAAQTRRVVEARRRFELLDHLREKRAAEWETEIRRQEGLEADELAVLRWRIRNADGSPENA